MAEKSRQKKSRLRRTIGFLVGNALFTTVVAFAALVYGWTGFARSLPDLHGWHTDAPASEFVAEDADDSYTLDDYLAQEARVFEELSALKQNDWASDPLAAHTRYDPSLRFDLDNLLDRNWNRSLLLETETPVGGAVLVHGLSDSPYSLRALGRRLHDNGWTVLWLRVPGHGTCPGALAHATHEDWAAAVDIAMKGVRNRLPDDAPLIGVGFSNGGALCADYAVRSIQDDRLPRLDALALVSPMIGLPSIARITRLYPIMGRISGLEKIAWSRVNAEIDPFKYNSWPMNANLQAWIMANRVENALARLDAAGRMDDFPPTIAFQSVVDATVLTSRLITAMFDRFESTRNRLVLYDINRVEFGDILLRHEFDYDIAPLIERDDLPYTLNVLTNVSPDTHRVHEHVIDGDDSRANPLDAQWPDAVYSLSHGALPIPRDDPIYGVEREDLPLGLSLGELSLRGETGVLMISESLMLRLRSNPFYDHLESRLTQWLAETLAPAQRTTPPDTQPAPASTPQTAASIPDAAPPTH